MLIDCTKYIFIQYVKEYGIYDEDGCLVGMKETAPEEVKKSFEEYQKKREEWEAMGID